MKKTMSVFAAAAMAAIFACVTSSRAEDVSNYVQNGLFACWDGVENAGRGVHDSSATSWKDLVGNRDLTIGGGASFTENSLYRSASSTSMAYYSESITTAKTLQLVFKRHSYVTYAVLASLMGYVNNGEGLLTLKNETIGSTAYLYHSAPEAARGAFTMVTLLLDSKTIYTNAAPVGAGSGAESWSSGMTTSFALGGRATNSNNGFFGDLFACRLYDRELTPDEIAENYAIDVTRFVDGDIGHRQDCLLAIAGAPFEIGQPSPSYASNVSMVSNETLSLSMPATQIVNGTATNTLVGWKLESLNPSTGLRTLVRSSEDPGESIDHCDYTHKGGAVFSWLWDVRDVLGVGAPVAAMTGENYLTLTAAVTGLGYTLQSAALKFAYGISPEALAYTNAVSAPVTEPGVYTATLTRLQPGVAYYVKAVLETSESHDIVESGVVCIQTTPDSTTIWYSTPAYIEGPESELIDTEYNPSPLTRTVVDFQLLVDKDQAPVFGLQCGNLFYNVFRNSSSCWAYAFKNDSGNWVTTNVRIDTHRHVFDFNFETPTGARGFTIDGGSVVNTTLSGAPTKTANYSLFLGATRNGANTYKYICSHRIYSCQMYEDGEIVRDFIPAVSEGVAGLYDLVYGVFYPSATATAYAASQTQSLHASQTIPITAEEVVSGNSLASVSLSFAAQTAAQSLCVAYGPVNAGTDPADWAGTAAVADIAVGATGASYQVPATWGSDTNLVMRFYFEGVLPRWSNPIYWRDYSAPSLADVVVDGTGGDTLVVSGTLESFPGADCTLAIYTGDSPTTLTNAWTGIAGSVRDAPGAFSLSLFEPDAASPRYFAPEGVYYVSIEARSGGQTVRTAPAEVTMSAAPAFLASSSTVARRTVTFKGSFSDVGAGTSATVTLYAGPSSAAEGDLVAVEAPITVTDKNEFSIVHTFPDFETTYKWQLRAAADTAGGTESFETRTAVATCKTLDTTTYTWKTSVASGNWSDAANWTDNHSGDSLGYPQSTAATAVFSAKSTASVAFTEPLAVGTLNLSGIDLSVAFTQGGASTNATKLTVSTLNMNGAQGSVTLDGVALQVNGGFTLGARRALSLVNGANLYSTGDFYNENYNEVTISGGSWFSCSQMLFGSGTITIDDSVVWTRSHDYVGRTRTGGHVIFKGEHPLWYHDNKDGCFFSNLANANVQLDFLVPVGGFDSAPIQARDTPKYYMGNSTSAAGSSALTVNVLDESPANFADETVTSPLIYWKKGINKTRILEGHLPDCGAGTSSDDAFAWGSGDYPPTLDVTIHGSSNAGQLQISATPETIESAGLSPGYGFTSLASGDTRSCAAPSGYVTLSATKRAVCTGWKLYSVDAATHSRSLVDSGSGASCVVAGTGLWQELEWQWRVEYLIDVVSAGNGTASAESAWVALGECARLSSTPSAGYAFHRWIGDVDPNYDLLPDLSFVVGEAHAITGVFSRVYYVSKTGDDANDGLSWATAKATIPAAIALDNEPYVLVSNGVYEITAAIQISKGAVVEGTGDRGAVIKLTASPASGDSTRCAVYLNHPAAALRNLAVCGTYTQQARGICIDAGGLVDNCSVTNNETMNLNQGGAGIFMKNGGVVRDSLIWHNWCKTSGGGGGNGGGIYMKAGLVEHCVISGNQIATGSGASYGGGIYVEGGTFRNSLVTANYSAWSPGGSGVSVLNGLVENCTIAGNYHGTSSSSVGLYITGAGTVRNCVIWANSNAASDQANWSTSVQTYTAENNCSTPRIPGAGNTDLDPAFVDAANGDYHLTFSAAVDAGVTRDWMATATDIDGNPRVSGAAPDMGCYEFSAEGLSCGFDVAVAGLLCNDQVSLSARVAGDDPANIRFTWTLTDTSGNTFTTNGVGLASVTIPLVAGLYDVALSVSNGSLSAESFRPAIVRVYGDHVYVDPSGGNSYPYSTRETAATNLLDAIAAATDGTTVHLSDGWHRIADTLLIPTRTTIVSDNGPESTSIFGAVATSGAALLVLDNAGAVLSGVTVTGKDSDGTQTRQWSGVRISAGMVTNCVIRDHKTVSITVHGAGIRMTGGTVVDCVLSNNWTTCSGGGGMQGGAIHVNGSNALVDRCLIASNEVSDGSTSYGGGASVQSGTIRNCLIVGNKCAKGYGGGLAVLDTGKAYNCTVVRNVSTIGSGGIYAAATATVVDCLAWDNTANGVPEDQADPGFVDAEGGDYHLNVASAAVDSGTAPSPGDFDLDHAPRVSGQAADKGCYEYDHNQFAIGISFDAETPFEESPVVFTAAATPAGTVLDDAQTWWTFDGTEPSASNFGARGAIVTNALPAGIYTVRFKTVYNGQEHSFVRPDWVIRYGRTVYLVEENEGAVPPYATPETAATNLMQAFTYAIDGSTLLIGDGTFRITAEQTLERHVAIRSVNGPSRTTIDATHSVRPFVVKSKDVVLDGLRIYRGHNWAQGGGLQMYSDAIITNCVFDSCRIQNNGGAGVYMTAGTVVDCVFTNCHTVSAYCDTQDGVAIWANGASCLIDRCLVVDSNEKGTKGNGAVYIGPNGGTVRNTVVTGSRMRKCGGIVLGADNNGNGSGKAINCTVTGNVTTTSGETAGVAALGASSVVRNTILWNNVNEADEQRAETSGAAARFDHCSTEDPIFVGRPGREFLIRSNSPCRDAGVTEPWMTGARDFYGKPRLDKPAKPVDIGAAECQKTDGTMVIMR
jgi:hypothetical protein